jgi:hypothetical protein
MPIRRLVRDHHEVNTNGKLTYRLPEIEGEKEIFEELMPLIYKFHPALDDTTGRLKQEPGIPENLLQGPELFLTSPDLDGFSHIGGIRIPENDTKLFLGDLRLLGWIIEE